MTKKPKSKAVIEISTADLGRLLGGLSARSIRALSERGDIVRLGPGRYDMWASVATYCISQRKAAAGRSSPASEEKHRLHRLQADAVERKNAEAARELVKVADVKVEWENLARYLRAGVLAATSRISAHLPQLGPTELAVVDRELREILTGLSDDRPPGLPS